MKTNHRLSNPIMSLGVTFGLPDNGTTQEAMNENGTLFKTLISVVIVLLSAVLAWRISAHIMPEVIVVLFLCGAAVAAFSMIFPMMAVVLSPVFAAFVGLSLGAMGAMVSRELSGSTVGGVISAMVNVSVVVSIGTLMMMLLMRRYYILSTINKTNSVLIGAVVGFFAAFTMMRVLSWLFGETPFFFDTTYGFNIIFGAVVAVFMAVSTIHHIRMVRINEHRRFPKYMEWYMALGVTFSLVWFYNECLNLILGTPLNETDSTETKSK